MIQRRHHRRRYGVHQTRQRKARIGKLASMAMLAVLLVIVSNKTLEFFGVGNAVRRTAAVLEIEDRGVINVSVDNGPLKRAENELKLYAGDMIVSSPRNYATLTLFDKSVARIDESTQLRIAESLEGLESSKITLELEEGTVWVATPTYLVYSGSIARTVSSPFLSVLLPPQSEFVMTPRSLTVFAADGLGLTVSVAGNDTKVIIGEGQQFTLPVGGEQTMDLYTYRNPLNPEQLGTEFVEKSRARYANIEVPDEIVVTGTKEEKTPDGVILVVENPKKDAVLETSTLKVSGRIGSTVEKVRINGYLGSIDSEKSTFSQELVLPDEDEVSITIEAVDADGVVIAEAIRTVTRNRKPPQPPTITTPAKSGESYLTSKTEIEISGAPPPGAIGILVNDYRLQLFKPGDTDWSYLANTKFDNYHYGENVFEVVAINRGGYRSDPATLIVTLGEGEEGVVTDPKESDTQPRRTRTTEEADLTNNLPLMPRSVSIFSPTKGSEYQTSELEVLIEGNVPAEAASVWVNGYRLRLFEQGKGFFNYIASVELSTLKRGRNVYDIVVRSESGHVLDELEYVVDLQVSR